MGKQKIVYFILLLLILPAISRASSYWMQVKGNGKVNQPVQISIYYGNIMEDGQRKPQTGEELGLTGDFRISVVDEEGIRTPVNISLKAEGWEGTFTPKKMGIYRIIGINDTHPVVDRSKLKGRNVLPVDYLCASYAVETDISASKPLQFLDILTVKNGNQITVKAFNNGLRAEKSTKIRVFNPENWEKELVVDERGEASFRATLKGLYIIREDWEDPRPGNYKGVSYVAVRHRCNYFLLME